MFRSSELPMVLARMGLSHLRKHVWDPKKKNPARSWSFFNHHNGNF